MWAIILHQMYRFRGGINRRIHQGKNWYYIRLFETSRVEHFAKIVFDYNPLRFFVKKMFQGFHKTLPINTF